MDIEFYNKLNQALHGNAGKIDRVMRFRYLNEFVKPGQILFAGSSLMEQFPIQEFIADFDLPLTIYNRGVGGFTTSEMLACMQDCVYALRPAYIFINIGTNDLNDPARRSAQPLSHHSFRHPRTSSTGKAVSARLLSGQSGGRRRRHERSVKSPQQ